MPSDDNNNQPKRRRGRPPKLITTTKTTTIVRKDNKEDEQQEEKTVKMGTTIKSEIREMMMANEQQKQQMQQQQQEDGDEQYEKKIVTKYKNRHAPLTIWSSVSSRKKRNDSQSQQQQVLTQDQLTSNTNRHYNYEKMNKIRVYSDPDNSDILDTYTVLDGTDRPTFSRFKHRVYFYSDCDNYETSYVNTLKRGRYYGCNKCHDFHRIREFA